MRGLALAYGLLNLGGILASYVYTVRTMRSWIVPRFEQNPDLNDPILFPPIVLPGMTTVACVTSLGTIHWIPDWMIQKLIERGHVPPGTSKESILGHFSSEEIHQARRISAINLSLLGSLILMGFINRFVYKLL